ncbi:DUF3223 domain-containing protein [Streptomyces canus]|uniref:DUF3223 domain-containing protein n=1 Tax=Streptomyces canus TaxID=58343 RepID=UPI00224F5CF9|nr:DUF3223 domain-containing protein [Streptomyces canus]MCX4854042.1 DUF3223 domain-containing protein [Streptomyces canus]WSW40495.1 DUF3223 domain-containing protein [Streptomyces canus]
MFLHDLAKLHPTPEKAVGPEVKHLLVRVNVSGYSDTRCFWALGNDDFSGPEC